VQLPLSIITMTGYPCISIDRFRILILLAAGLVGGMLLTVAPATAATKTWTGATNNDWGTGTNWSAAGAPAAADTANINLTSGPLVSTTTAVAATVNVGNTANGSLTISGGGVFNRWNRLDRREQRQSPAP